MVALFLKDYLMSKSRQITDFPRSEAGLVDRYIGTAYQVVLGVYKNLDKIEDVHKAILTIPTIAEDAVNKYLILALEELRKFLEDHKDKVDAEYATLLKAINDLQEEVRADLITLKKYRDESKTNADISASKALESSNSAKAAKTSETNAKTSETNANTSATNAKNSETKANTSASNAKTSEENAKKSAQEAKDVVNDLNNSNEIVIGVIEEAREIETRVKLSEDKAKKWADNAVDTPVETGKYSAKHWAVKAKESVEFTLKVPAEPTIETDTPTLDYHGVQLGNRLGDNSVELNTTTTNGSRAKPSILAVGTGYTTETFFDFWDIASRPGVINPITHEGSNVYTLPLTSIDTVSSSTPFIPNNFDMAKVNYAAYDKFLHNSNHSMHGVIKGKIRFLYRTVTDLSSHMAYESIPPLAFLCIATELSDKPVYQLATRMGLSYQNSSVSREPKFLNTRSADDFLHIKTMEDIPYDEIYNKVKTNNPINDGTTITGSIPSNSVEEELANTAVAGQRTTTWIKCNPMSSHYVIHSDYAGAEAANTRVQWKDKLGFIHYDSVMSGKSCNRVINIHPNAVEFRIWFAYNQPEGKLWVYSLPLEYNPLYGAWYEYDMDVNSVIDLDPNQLYRFTISFYKGSNITKERTVNDIILLNGGLSMVTESRDLIQDEFNNRGIL